MNNRKYELTDVTMKFEGRTLYRIRALKDFADVKKGKLGGWVQTEDNLSQEGYCWVYNNAKCMDNARMYDNSTMFDRSEMHDNTIMYDYSRMYGNSAMYDYSRMFSNSLMFGNSELKGNAKLYGKLVSSVDDFIEINNPDGRLVTCVRKGNEILYNVGCQDEITEETFRLRIKNEDGGLKQNPHRIYYYKIIEMAKLYFGVK